MRRWLRLHYALPLAFALGACACTNADVGGPEQTVTSEKPFAEGGKIGIRIDSGDCEIRLASSPNIRVTLSGNVGRAHSDIGVTGDRADVSVTDTPHSNFHCALDVPPAAELRVHLGGGNLSVTAGANSTDIDNTAGNTDVFVVDPGEYASVDASVGAGDLDAGPFGEHRSGLNARVNWTGHGTRTLVARSTAGNLTLRPSTSK